MVREEPAGRGRTVDEQALNSRGERPRIESGRRIL